MLTPSEKGAVAEAEIAAAAVRLGYVVCRPLSEGRRYDLIIDTGPELLRVQCKWAQMLGDVLSIRIRTSRYTPNGYVRTTYDASEIDAVAAYSPDLDECFFIPIERSPVKASSICVSGLPETTRRRRYHGRSNFASGL